MVFVMFMCAVNKLLQLINIMKFKGYRKVLSGISSLRNPVGLFIGRVMFSDGVSD